MEEVALALGKMLGPEADLDWLWQLNDLTSPKVSPDPILLAIDQLNTDKYFAFVLLILSEIVLGFVGFYLGAAVTNSNYNSNTWNWNNEATAAIAAGGGIDGGFIPYAMYYSAEVIGFEATALVACGGSYLGAAAENGEWDPLKWNFTDPKTLNGAFVGIQQSMWLVDALAYIPVFTRNAGLPSREALVFTVISYLTGAMISYYYIAEDNEGNYDFWEWDITSPVIYYGMMRGFQSGTRLPPGLSEIGLDALDAWKKSKDQPDPVGAFIHNFAVRKRYKIAGALWLAWVTVSVENESFNPDKWDTGTFGTLEAFLNGLVFGKDFDSMLMDLGQYVLGKNNAATNNSGLSGVGTKNKKIKTRS